MGLESVELLMAIERRFQVEIPDSEAVTMMTVGEVHLWLCKTLGEREPSLAGQPAIAWTDDEIWTELRLVIVDQLRVPSEAVTPQAHIVHDLGAD